MKYVGIRIRMRRKSMRVDYSNGVGGGFTRRPAIRKRWQTPGRDPRDFRPIVRVRAIMFI